jgi:hypothetical protein
MSPDPVVFRLLKHPHVFRLALWITIRTFSNPQPEFIGLCVSMPFNLISNSSNQNQPTLPARIRPTRSPSISDRTHQRTNLRMDTLTRTHMRDCTFDHWLNSPLFTRPIMAYPPNCPLRILSDARILFGSTLARGSSARSSLPHLIWCLNLIGSTLIVRAYLLVRPFRILSGARTL